MIRDNITTAAMNFFRCIRDLREGIIQTQALVQAMAATANKEKSELELEEFLTELSEVHSVMPTIPWTKKWRKRKKLSEDASDQRQAVKYLLEVATRLDNLNELSSTIIKHMVILEHMLDHQRREEKLRMEYPSVKDAYDEYRLAMKLCDDHE